jgi:hypothetical protein
MKKTIQTLLQAHIILRACFLIALPAIAGSHTLAQTSTGTTIDLSDPLPASPGTGWTYSDNVYTILTGAIVTVTGNDVNDYRRIEIEDGAEATVTLDNAIINTPSYNYDRGAIMLDTDAKLTLILADGTDNVVNGPNNWPAIAVRANENAELTIQGNGSLTAQGGTEAAGIGGNYGGNGGHITISSGTVTATGGGISGYYSGGAGIGGGRNGDGCDITISGGTVTANTGHSGAGIGGGFRGTYGGYGGNGGNVTISGGTVTANGGNGGAGIGGGLNRANTGSVTITGGSVKMNSHTGPTPTNEPGGTGQKLYRNTLTVGNPAIGRDIAITAGSINNEDCDATNTPPTPGKYGIKDVKTDTDGKVYFYLPKSTGNELVKLEANDKEYDKNYTRNENNDNAQTLLLLYGITLSKTDTYDFSADYGYDEQAAFTVTVTNAGTSSTGALDVALSGTDQSAFTFSSISPSSIDASGGTAGFTVTPELGLAVGTTSTATVTVSNSGNGIKASFDVRFTVNKKNITVSGGTVTEKPYDGKHDAKVTGLTFDYDPANDDLEIGTDYEVGNAAYTEQNAGSDKEVTATVTLKGTAKANNYNLTGDGTFKLTNGKITQRKIYITGGKAETKDYDGTNVATIDALEFSGLQDNETLVFGAAGDYTATGATFTDVDVADDIQVTVTGVSLTSSDKAKNYELMNGTTYSTNLQGNIQRATLTEAHLAYTLTGATYNGTQQGIDEPELQTTPTPYTGLGTVTVKYESADDAGATYPLNADRPVNAGSYTVKITVGEGDNFNATTTDIKLTNGTFDIGKLDPTLTHLDVKLTDVDYNGTQQGITDPTTIYPYTGLGKVTVKYDGNTAAPTDAKTCAVTLEIAGGANFNATDADLSPGDFTIRKIDPLPAHLNVDLTGATYNGTQQGITTPTPKTPYTGLGAVTAIYYNGDPTPPTAAKTYAVTVDIDPGINYNGAIGLLLGNYTIAAAVPPVSAFSFTLSDFVYDGSAYPVTVTIKPGVTGLGDILAVKYTGTAGTDYPASTTVPTAAGTYIVTVDIAAGTNYAATTGLEIGNFTIDKAKPTIATLAFTLRNATYDDRPHPVAVTAATGITGLGAITVLYNGSTTVPVYPGTYTVTADLAAGANYTAVTGLQLGTFSIYEPTTPVIRRLVTLLPTPGLTTDPPAGSYYINSGTNFTFRLTPDVPSPDGTPPQVQTNRAGAPDGSSGIRITANADGSYTVVILGIRENIEITLSTPTDNASVADAALTLSTAPGTLVITNSRPDAATLRVYTPAGVLVRLTTVPPGTTTRLSVPSGIYIVSDGGAFRRKAAVAR